MIIECLFIEDKFEFLLIVLVGSFWYLGILYGGVLVVLFVYCFEKGVIFELVLVWFLIDLLCLVLKVFLMVYMECV